MQNKRFVCLHKILDVIQSKKNKLKFRGNISKNQDLNVCTSENIETTKISY